LGHPARPQAAIAKPDRIALEMDAQRDILSRGSQRPPMIFAITPVAGIGESKKGFSIAPPVKFPLTVIQGEAKENTLAPGLRRRNARPNTHQNLYRATVSPNFVPRTWS
jgi:hypothetical protein